MKSNNQLCDEYYHQIQKLQLRIDQIESDPQSDRADARIFCLKCEIAELWMAIDEMTR